MTIIEGYKDGEFNEDVPVKCQHCKAYPLWWEFDQVRAKYHLVDDHGRKHAPHCEPAKVPA
jgi:glutaredoxin